MGLVIAAGPSSADNYAELCSGGDNQTGCAPDNDLHIWCFGGQLSGEDLKASIRWAMDNMANNTVMRKSQATSCASDTDVRFQEVNLPVGRLGSYACTNANVPGHPRQCAAADVRIDPQEIQRVGNDSAYVGSDGNMESGELDLNRDMTACHELGHSLGFRHHDLPYYQGSGPDHDKDCMLSDWAEPDSGLWRRYNDHHRDHIRDFINDTSSRFDGEL